MNTGLVAETTLFPSPKKNGWGGPRYKKRDRTGETISKPTAAVEKINRTCIGRGYLGGGCGNTFVAEGPYNRLCSCCQRYAERYGS